MQQVRNSHLPEPAGRRSTRAADPIPLRTMPGSQHQSPLLPGAPQLSSTLFNQAPPAVKSPCGVRLAGWDAELS
ncbi:hypothetical protein NDU88_008837 [Pleurodeles waltl]|uniref:Uncharacterized protein n=1 Tax=Pleurodeles waltl TaxID=8319 RepID=A0AAV7RWP8_PLEWA|nr:hypothetical protein NDU88_008837 [Pleurodeles waltl]